MSWTFIGYILAIVHLKTNISALVFEFGLVPGSGIFLYICLYDSIYFTVFLGVLKLIGILLLILTGNTLNRQQAENDET